MGPNNSWGALNGQVTALARPPPRTDQATLYLGHQRDGILRNLRKKDRPGVRVIAAAHGVAVSTVQRIAHEQ